MFKKDEEGKNMFENLNDNTLFLRKEEEKKKTSFHFLVNAKVFPALCGI